MTGDSGIEELVLEEVEVEEIPPTPCGWHFPALLFQSIFIPSLPLFLFPFGNFAFGPPFAFHFHFEWKRKRKAF